MPARHRHGESTAGAIDVTLASFDDSATLAPTAHIWVQEKLPWVKLGDALPQYARTLDGSPRTT